MHRIISLYSYIFIIKRKTRTRHDSHEKQAAYKTFTDDNDDDERANKKNKGHLSSL
jgi:hypothetical protein